jgi:hypothetical protein
MGDRFNLQRFAYQPVDAVVPEDSEPEQGTSGAGSSKTQYQIVGNIVSKNQNLKEIADRLAKKAKASRTISNYSGITERFKEFCGTNDYSFENFSEQAVLHFVLQLDSEDVSVSTLGQVKPALTLAERLAGKKESAFTETVDTYIEAAKRRAAENKEPARKAVEAPQDAIEKLLAEFVRPYWDGEGRADPYHLRTVMRAVIVRYTFCRFNCYNKLRACDVQDKGDCMVLHFTSAKNDQMHKGSMSYVVNEEAVKTIRFASRELGLRLGDQNDKNFLNCALHKGKDRVSIVQGRNVRYSNSTSALRKLLEQVGIDPTGMTDKSFKSLGVTTSLENGVSLEDVMHHGRWRTLSMPLTYKLNSEAYKKGVAKKV